MMPNFEIYINRIIKNIEKLIKMINDEYDLKLHNHETVNIAIETGITIETAANIFNMPLSEIQQIKESWDDFLYKSKKNKEEAISYYQDLLKVMNDIIYADNTSFSDILLRLANHLEQMDKESDKIPDLKKSISNERLWRDRALKKALQIGLDLTTIAKIFNLPNDHKVCWKELQEAIFYSQKQTAINMRKAGFSNEKIIELCECSDEILKSIENM